MREWRLPFPFDEISDDPLERFLVAEAILTRYDLMMQKEQERHQKREEASRKAKEMLQK